jgi:hypothetical protein
MVTKPWTLTGVTTTGITFYERVAELAETIASEWVVARHLGFDYDPYEAENEEEG